MAKRSKKTTLANLESSAEPKAPLDGGLLVQLSAPVLKALQKDLETRAKESPALQQALKARHAEEKRAKRTADNFAQWQERFVEQVAAAWFLSCVFVRTLEDRGLLEKNRLAGPNARDSEALFFEMAPSLNARDYLLMVFKELSRFDATRDLFDERHNPVWLLSPSAEGARELLTFFRSPQIEAPALRFGQADSRFLGDLYQDLNENVRKRYALLQTPRFVESFILDRTLERAVERFGLNETTLIDPTCGSGHFLLGAFERLFDHRLREQPGLDKREAARLALDAVAGADINPYAVAIAKFRLALAYFEKAEFDRLRDAPELPFHVVVADSLLHNPHVQLPELADQAGVTGQDVWRGSMYALEDEEEARAVLHKQYAAVVGNPPYITVKDATLRDRYREMYESAAGKYSVAVPFTERFFQLGVPGAYVGMITANSFMKREFGKTLIEKYLPKVNLDIIINTSGAYIPGHGTPTVLLFGTAEPPQSTEVLTVLASRGEPSTPDDPEQGEVWSSIAGHWSDPGFENDYITVSKTGRADLAGHPWSLAGGGASELKEYLESRASARLGEIAASVGISCVTGEDDVYALPPDVAQRLRVGRTRGLVTGEMIRDWSYANAAQVLFPYDEELRLCEKSELEQELKYLWRFRSVINKRKRFGVPMLERGLTWYELQELYADKLRTPLSIAFAEVASHNHFVLDRGGKVFKQTAPIIKLPPDATEDDHYALLAYLNSSTALFLMKQLCHNKGYGADAANARVTSLPWEDFYQYSGTALAKLPIVPGLEELAALGKRISALGHEIQNLNPTRELVFDSADELLSEVWALVARMSALQEAIDWKIYELFGLHGERVAVAEDAADAPGARAFEKKVYGECRTVNDPRLDWFKDERRHRAEAECSEIQHARLSLIESSRELKLLESFDYKRRWSSPIREQDLLRVQVVSALEAVEQLLSAESAVKSRLELQTVAADTRLDSACVPFLPVYRYSLSGLTKHQSWQHTWDLQRREDAGENVGEIPVPPKYAQKDFAHANYWRLRGKLDVPKERFISYPGCESDQDGEPVYGWAGWNHLERAQALAALYQTRKQDEGWEKERLTPMLAGLLELLPWLKQWHNEPSEEYQGQRLGDFFETFLDGQCLELGLTHDDLRAWRPPEKKRGRGKKRKDQ